VENHFLFAVIWFAAPACITIRVSNKELDKQKYRVVMFLLDMLFWDLDCVLVFSLFFFRHSSSVCPCL
jgi:hypothetical protein